MQGSENLSAVDAGVPTLSLALSLAGGVSGGCWSAGTLDYLVEALDAWEQARGTDPLVPSHRVLLHAMAGTSAGAQAAALLAMGLRSEFAPVRLTDESTTPPHAQHNPLYSGWVLGASAADLLDERDGCRRRFTSLLDGSCTDEIADRVLADRRCAAATCAARLGGRSVAAALQRDQCRRHSTESAVRRTLACVPPACRHAALRVDGDGAGGRAGCVA